MAARGDVYTLEGPLQQMGGGVKMGEEFLSCHTILSSEMLKWAELMGNRSLGINGSCKGQQEEESAGSSSDIHSDEPGAHGVRARSGPGPAQTV